MAEVQATDCTQILAQPLGGPISDGSVRQEDNLDEVEDEDHPRQG